MTVASTARAIKLSTLRFAAIRVASSPLLVCKYMSASICWQPRGRLIDPARWRACTAPKGCDPPDLQVHGAGYAVRGENLVHGSGQQSCSSCRPAVMIIDHVPAVHVPPDHAASRVAA